MSCKLLSDSVLVEVDLGNVLVVRLAELTNEVRLANLARTRNEKSLVRGLQLQPLFHGCHGLALQHGEAPLASEAMS